MSTAALGWRPLYDAGESVEQFAARQRQAFAAFELAWREGRVSLKLKGYYDQLVRDVGTNAYAWWTEERWAEAFDVSASTIKRVLAALTAAGLIRRERQFGSSSRTYLTSYDRAVAVRVGEATSDTDNHKLLTLHTTPLLPQHDITNSQEVEDLSTPMSNQNPEAQDGVEVNDYRQPVDSFFGTNSELTIGSLLRRDHVKNRHLTFGAAGESSLAAADPHSRQVLEREGVADFVLAPQLVQQAAGALQAVSQYLDTQHTVRDRPRLFAWLATHGFGRQLLAGRHERQAVRGHRRGAPPDRGGPTRRSTSPAVPNVSPALPAAQAEVWTQVLAQLGSDATAPALLLWLQDLMLLKLDDTAAVIGTPNVFVRDAVAPHADQLAAAVAAVAGRPIAVDVVVDGWR